MSLSNVPSRQFLSTKLGRIRVFSHAEEAGLKQGDFVVSVNGKEVGWRLPGLL